MSAEETKEYEGFIDLGMDTDDVHEPEPVPTGAYDLVIQSAKAVYDEKSDGSGRYLKKMQVLVDIEGVQNAATIFHTITLPQVEMEKKKKDFLIVLMKKFYKLFNVPMSNRGINTTDLIGARASSVLVELTSYAKVDPETGATGPSKNSNKINLDNVKV